MNEENKSPCADCEKEKECLRRCAHRECKAWRSWFHEQWQKIRKLFGVECVDSSHEETKRDEVI